MSTHTPWGQSQHSEKIATGIMSYSTAGHGGVHLSPKRNAMVPSYMRNDDGFYEEDVDWSICAVVFPDEYKAFYPTDEFNIKAIGTDINEIAKKTLLEYYPDDYERFYNVKLTEGQSSERDKQIAKVRNKNNYVVVSAIADDNDMVEVYATLGGEQTCNGKRFKVSLEAYRNRTGSFVIDLDNHAEIIKR